MFDLREAAGEELRRVIDGGWDPRGLRTPLTHRGIKAFTWDCDQYIDESNFAGSLCGLQLFLPGEFMFGRGTDFQLIEWLDPSGELAHRIRELGLNRQKSGKGANNFRCDIVEAILSSLGNRAPCP